MLVLNWCSVLWAFRSTKKMKFSGKGLQVYPSLPPSHWVRLQFQINTFSATTFIYNSWITVLRYRLPIMIATKFEILLNRINKERFCANNSDDLGRRGQRRQCCDRWLDQGLCCYPFPSLLSIYAWCTVACGLSAVWVCPVLLNTQRYRLAVVPCSVLLGTSSGRFYRD